MHEVDFTALTERLLAAGIRPRYAQRSVQELKDHLADLEADLTATGLDGQRARRQAVQQLGDIDTIGQALASAAEQRCWYYRWPLAGRILLPLACLAVLPATPLLAGTQHAGALLRWGLCVLLSGLVTISLFAVMQFSLTLS